MRSSAKIAVNVIREAKRLRIGRMIPTTKLKLTWRKIWYPEYSEYEYRPDSAVRPRCGGLRTVSYPLSARPGCYCAPWGGFFCKGGQASGRAQGFSGSQCGRGSAATWSACRIAHDKSGCATPSNCAS